MMTRLAVGLAPALLFVSAHARAADAFTYDPPGKLANGSGKGRIDAKVYAEGIRFPIESAPAFANSQVWGRGGLHGGGGSQCDAQNFSYPWRDNYCETRDWAMPLCPAGEGHQGQDIRAATCKDKTHRVVAVTDGTITQVGTYSVYLTAKDGTRFEYLHMANVAVKEADKVTRGQLVGMVSNQFNGESTTVHLHFNVRQNVAGVGSVYVPTYMSLVKAYETLLAPPKPEATTEPPPPPPKEVVSTPLPPPEETPPSESDDGCAVSRDAREPQPSPIVLVAPLVVVGALLRRRRVR